MTITNDLLKDIRSKVRPRPWLRLEPAACALLVVDLQRGFAHSDGSHWLPACEAVLPQVRRLLTHWRRLGAPVVFTRHGQPAGGDGGMMTRFYSQDMAAHATDAELIPDLAGPDEPVLLKSTYDAFVGTDLEERLDAAGVRQVLVTGVQTHRCVETTARSAFVRGFEVFVAADATASRSDELHQGSLLGMADSVAVLHSVEEILS